MKNSYQKKFIDKIIYSWPILVLLSGIVLFFLFGLISFLIKTQTSYENKKIAQEKFERLTQEKDKLYLEIEKLQTSQGLEEKIRNKFGLVKEGEEMIVIVDPPLKEEKSETGLSSGFFSFLKNLFQ